VPGWHIDLICEYLEAVTAGDLQFLIFNVPPRNMKSLLVSVLWPTWEWGPQNRPHLRYLFSSYSGELSIKHSVDRRIVIESDWYQKHWGKGFKLTSDNNRKTEFENDKRGVMSTTSTGATATGKGGQRIVIDDPLNPKQALSDSHRLGANRHFDQTLYSRLNDKSKDAMIVIMQRLHERDLTGHLLSQKKEMGWTVISLPAEAPNKSSIILPRTGKRITREPGDVLWPGKEPESVLAQHKIAQGAYAYAGQYQQKPAPEEGGYVKKAWWRRYNTTIMPPFDQLIISSDLALKEAKTSSHVANHVWASKGPNKYLLDRDYRRMGFNESIQSILTLRKRWNTEETPVTGILIEDKANGPAVIEVLRREIPGVIAENPEGNKISRAMSQAPQIEAGGVWVPSEPWGEEFIEAWAIMPNGENWDDIDAASQALKYLARYEIMPSQLESFIGGTLSASQLDIGQDW